MLSRVYFGLFLWFLPALLSQDALPSAASRQIDFSRDIAPLFSSRCQGCHGAQQQLSGLRLDNRSSALAGGYSGAVIQPGNSAGSKLIHMVAGLKKGAVMPPTGEKLTPDQIGILRAWIDQGAAWPETAAVLPAAKTKSKHWAFLPPRRVEPPPVRKPSWVTNPIDNFVLARLEAAGIDTSPAGEPTTLIRRLSLDLTGLPPTPGEVASFVSDERPDAYERLVDRLLASPHYGEKWARHWLDLARYADSDGYEKDSVRPHAWRYRHWLIEALNRDMPFDEFTRETIAGDLLPNASAEQKIATGFHRNTLTNREGGTDPEQFRYEQNLDRASTVGSVWLGLTVGCAQCHDHKYDPIRQKDFYQLFAFFNRAEEVNLDAPLAGEMGPYLQALPGYEKKRRELLAQYKVAELQPAWEAKMREAGDHPGKSHDWDFAYGVLRVLVDGGPKILRLDPAQRTEQQSYTLTKHFIQNYGSVVSKERYDELKFKELRDKLQQLDDSFPALSQAQTIADMPGAPKSHIHIRGDFRETGIEVEPDTPAFLHTMSKGLKPPRVALAEWLVSPDNPLTARVAVNRMWQELFGRGLVRTSEDFGAQGEKPSHPELLDWLATEFIARGWSMKQMHKLIVQSSVYRQSSRVRKDLQSRDPDNMLLARQNRLRLPAELIRDIVLASSGLLNPVIGGKSIRPPQPEGVASLGYGSSKKWEESTGMDRYRRGLYIHFQRTTPYPQLMNFDAPDSNLSCSRRQRSNTPLQALNLLNDPVFFEAAQGLATRMLREKQGSVADRINYGFQLCLGRPASPREKDRLAGYFHQQLDILKRDAKAAEAMYPARLEGADPYEAAAFVGVGRTLLNLDEFITRE